MTDEVKAATSTQISASTRRIKARGTSLLITRASEPRAGGAGGTDAATLPATAENHFYQAALLLLEASQKHIFVTLNWRKRWRQIAQMPSVVRIADYCGDLPP